MLKGGNVGGEIPYLIDIIREAGELVESMRGEVSWELKDDGTKVSEADRASSDFLNLKLKERFFDFGIIDEERSPSSDQKDKDYCWVIDPIDNTKQYLEGGDGYGILIGLLYRNTPIFGIVMRPSIKQIAFGLKGEGAYLVNQNNNYEKIPNLDAQETTQRRVLISNSRYSDSLRNMLDRVSPTELIRKGGSLKTLDVALGDADLFLCPKENRMHIWDLCAPQVILEETGGVFTYLDGSPVSYTGNTQNDNVILATRNVGLHNEILGLLK